MGTELAVLNNSTTPMIAEEGLGLGSALAVLMQKPTKVELVQALSKSAESAKPGSFWNDKMKLAFEDATEQPFLQFVPVRFHQIRERFINGKWEEGAKPVCRSYDGIVPVMGTEENKLTPFAPACMDPNTERVLCDEAKFAKEYRKGQKAANEALPNGGKPMCNSRWVITFIEASTRMLMYMICSRMSTPNVRELRNGIIMNATAHNQKNALLRRQGKPASDRVLNIFDYLVTAKSKVGPDNKNRIIWFPSVDPIKSVEEVAEYGALYKSFWERREEFAAEWAAQDDPEEAALNQEATQQPAGAGL